LYLPAPEEGAPASSSFKDAVSSGGSTSEAGGLGYCGDIGVGNHAGISLVLATPLVASSAVSCVSLLGWCAIIATVQPVMDSTCGVAASG